jgi:hypothetical protein
MRAWRIGSQERVRKREMRGEEDWLSLTGCEGWMEGKRGEYIYIYVCMCVYLCVCLYFFFFFKKNFVVMVGMRGASSGGRDGVFFFSGEIGFEKGFLGS